MEFPRRDGTTPNGTDLRHSSEELNRDRPSKILHPPAQVATVRRREMRSKIRSKMGIMKASSPAHTPHLTPHLSSLPHTREQTATFQQCLVIQKLPQRRNVFDRLRQQALRTKTAASMAGNRSGAAPMVGPSRRRWPGAALRQRIPRPTPSRNTPASAKASSAGIAFIPISTPHPDGSASHPYQSVVARRRTHPRG